jgi:hypothetical protein
VGGGLSAPSAQIGALSGVTHSMTGLASGLVETLREIGGAVGIAAVSTLLVSRAGEIAGADPAARGLAAANAFHAAFWGMFVVAALGALTAAIAFQRRTTQKIESEFGEPEMRAFAAAGEQAAARLGAGRP